MKKVCFAAAAIAALLTGCTSVQSAKGPDLNGISISERNDAIAHINVQNSGFYFLSFPIAAGSADIPGTTAFFSRDTVNIPTAVNMATREAKRLGASKLVDLTSDRSSTMIPLPIPFLFFMKSVNVSGNAVR